MYAKQPALIMECFDLLASVPFLKTNKEKREIAQNIIDTLGSYPKPKQKEEDKAKNPAELGAYLYTSKARNTTKLYLLGYMSFEKALKGIASNFERALGLLTDENK